jgi:hypothetical protein
VPVILRVAAPGSRSNITLDFGTRTVILQNTLTLKDLPGGSVAR